MKKIYISLGSNKGSEFLAFKKSKIYSEDFIIYAFEPEPRCFRHIEKVKEEVPNIIHIKKCAYHSDEIVSFNVGNNTVSGTLRSDKRNGLTSQTQMMQAIDICKWMNENINEDDYVIMTMDIEGSEYDVLPHMLLNKCSTFINKFYIQFHGKKMKDETIQLEKQLKKELTERWGDNFFDRYVEGNTEIFGQAYKDLDPNMFNNIGELEY